MNAFLIEDTLTYAGYEIVGPAKTVSHALALLERGGVDAALLDLQIDNEISYDVGRRLDQLHIPWAITTAHPPSFIGSQFAQVIVLSKPFTMVALVELIEKLLDGRDGTETSA